MSKENKENKEKQTYSGDSIASKWLSGTWLGNLLGYPSNTYIDGYGTTRNYANLEESAQGQQLSRMKNTAKNYGKVALTGMSFGNPLVARSTIGAVLPTGAQSYFITEGLRDAYNRFMKKDKTAEDAVWTGLDLAGAIPAVGGLYNGLKKFNGFKFPTKATVVTENLPAKEVSFTPNPKSTNGRTSYTLMERPRRLSEAELAGIPKGERNLQTKPTTWRQGEDAVKMFSDYGEVSIPEKSELYPELLKYVPEARERYGLVGNTSITDEQIAKGLYKRAMQLSGEGNGAVNSLGEPILLFRGDTRRYHVLQDRISPEDLVNMRGTMDNSLGNLFLGEFPSNYQGTDRYLGTHRFFNGDWTFEKSGTGNIGIRKSYLEEAAKDPNFKDGGYTLYSGVFGRHRYPIIVRKLPGYAMESGINDLNAAVVRTEKVRDATPEISVLNDEFLVRGMYGSSPHMRTKYIEDADGFPMYQHPDGTTTPALVGEENRIGMAEHYRYVLDDAYKNKQGLLRSNKNSPLRDEHGQYTYYAIPNFNNHNVKYLLGYDLTYPLENSWALYRKQGGNLPIIAKSGIHIKKKNRGKFTASAKRAGMGVQEYARKVLNDPNATPLQKRRANFARNAKKFKHN